MNYKFIVANITDESKAAIMDAARMYGLYPYEVCSLYNAQFKTMKTNTGRIRLEELTQDQADRFYICGLDAIKVFSNNYYAKISMYRRSVKDNYYFVSDPNDRKSFLSDIEPASIASINKEIKDGVYSIDIETNGLNAFDDKARILCVSVNGRQVQESELQELQPSLLIGHNLKFDLLWLNVHWGINFDCSIYDTMVAEHLIDENRAKGLDDLVFRYTRIENYWSNIDLKNTENINKEELEKYNNYDSLATYLVWTRQHNLIGEYKLFEFEMSKLRNLLLIEKEGMKVNLDLLHNKLIDAKRARSELEQVLKQEYPNMNFNSQVQLRNYLYENRKYPIISYTEKGNPSVDNSVLQELSESFPEDTLVKNLSNYRTLTKLVSTYYENIQKLTDKNGYLHGHFNQAQVVTGRLSSGGGVNFQNIPSKNKDAVESLFVSRYDQGKIFKIDYSQLELRVLAELSGDSNMLEAFNNGVDLHTKTSQLLNIDRQKAKTMNFRIVYGGGTREETTAWFSAYPGAKKWIDEQVSHYHRSGFSQALTGRIRHLPPPPKDWKELKHIERQAVNSIIQGLASDICQIAIDYLIEDYNIINTVHDSILIDTLKEGFCVELLKDIKIACEELPKTYMLNQFNYRWSTPLTVTIEVGDNWGSMKEWKGETI